MPDIKSRDDAIANIQSRLIILNGEGEEIPLQNVDPDSAIKTLDSLSDRSLSTYIREEIGHEDRESPPSMKALRKLEILDYEPASDSGHFRFYPAGSIMLDLLESWACDIAVNRFRAMKIETPEIYDWSVPEIREQGISFHERHYTVSAPGSKKEWVLRFAGDFGMFRMLKDAHLSYRNLPLRIYELSKSFRYEKRGELSGLKRLRYFTMPDIHSFTADIESGFEEYAELFNHYRTLAMDSGIEYAIVFRVVESFYAQNRDKIVELLARAGKPALIELLSGMKHYWVLKSEFQAIDSVGGSCQLSTVQLDTVDSERYGISYTDREGRDKGCVICHSSVGSLERWIYALMENAMKLKRPVLPLWVSPEQVRIIPVSLSFMEYAVEIIRKMNVHSIRAVIDDRNERLARKVLDSETGWIPYVIVIGEKELNSGSLSVNSRYTGERFNTDIMSFIQKLESEVGGKPLTGSRLPEFLSRRPSFT